MLHQNIGVILEDLNLHILFFTNLFVVISF